MTDNEIIKALGCCKIKKPPYKCEECPLLRGVGNACISECKELAYDLIKRQQAEIADERAKGDICAEVIKRQDKELANLKVELKAIQGAANSYKLHYGNMKAEIAREFADRLKKQVKKFTEFEDGIWDYTIYVVTVEDIDNLLKEMEKENE